jgi:CDP-paratose 2-epimerase
MQVGILQWFHFNEHLSVERAVMDLKDMGVRQLRTGFSWADDCRPEALEWFDWLIPRLAEEFEILPCFNYVPPSLSRKNKTNSPPRNIHHFAQFVDAALTRYGKYFSHVELWNEPNDSTEWNRAEDPDYELFVAMIREAARVAHEHGKTVVLGGMTPADPEWLRLVAGKGLLESVDIIGVHGFPGTWDALGWTWQQRIGVIQQVLDEEGSNAKIWITEAGCSSTLGEETQMQRFAEVLDAPVDRVYWYALYDLHPSKDTTRGVTTGYNDKHEYHMGIMTSDGDSKKIHEQWAKLVKPTVVANK